MAYRTPLILEQSVHQTQFRAMTYPLLRSERERYEADTAVEYRKFAFLVLVVLL